MATPSLTSGGLWYDTYNVTRSGESVTLRVGVWTYVTNSYKYQTEPDFAGSVVYKGSPYVFSGVPSIPPNQEIFVLRIS